MLDVYLFRHGETYCNNDGRHTGWLPYGLNDTGREQADRAGEHFRDFPFDRYFCSDLVRTRETFEHIFGQRDDCEYTELLREANSGELAGMKYTECAEKYGERYAQARKTWSFRQFGGDDVEDLFARARGFLKKMEELPKDVHTVAAVTHAGTMRTLAVAWAETASDDCLEAVKAGGLHFAAVAAISDPVREDVPAAVARCLEAGIGIKIVTGDTPATAREIARQIGLWNDAADGERNHITGTEFAAMSDEELLERVQELKIMSRARPLDKQRLVKLLQQRGEVVAVTGDGTNDAPALNFANVGLSMGSGTSVAKDASDITLLDDSFASIATAVMWGRSLYRNIQRFVLFQLTINFAAITICFIGALFGTDMPLTVVQILWVNIIMDTFAAMAMASLPPNPEVMRDKPRPRDEFIITPAMARTLFTCGAAMVVVLLGMLFRWTILQGGLTVEQLTVFFSTFVFLQFWNMFNAKGFETCHSVFTCLGGCREFFLILAAIGVGQVLIVEFGGEVFRTEPLSWMQWAEVIGFTSLLAVSGEIIRAIHRKRKQLR